MVSSPHCFPRRRWTRLCPRCGVISGTPTGFGGKPGQPSPAQHSGTRGWRTYTGPLHLTTSLGRRFGCLLGTFHYRPSPSNWLLDTCPQGTPVISCFPTQTSLHQPTVPPPPQPNPLRPPWIIVNHPAFTVRRLLDVWRWGWGFQYLVDWVGYGPEEWSWIKRSLILDPDLLRDFYSQYPEKPCRPPASLSWLVRVIVTNLFFSSCVLFSSLCFAASCLSSCFHLVRVCFRSGVSWPAFCRTPFH